MAGKKPVDMSNEELLKMEKTSKIAVYITLFSALIMLISGIGLTIHKKKFNALTTVALSMGIIALPNINNLKAAQKEKKARGL